MRNTRRLQLTEAGRAYPARVRTKLPVAVRHIALLLRGFTKRHQQVTLQIVASNRYVDLIDSRIYVAVRNREFEPDSAITIRWLAREPAAVAAP
jgi:DNA-binding transcriptional LysR family regulator